VCKEQGLIDNKNGREATRVSAGHFLGTTARALEAWRGPCPVGELSHEQVWASLATVARYDRTSDMSVIFHASVVRYTASAED
jgi:hypothetical protein